MAEATQVREWGCYGHRVTTPIAREYIDGDEPWWNTYLVPNILALAPQLARGTRVLDLGCGNGHIAGILADRGCEVVGVDPSHTGIERARERHPRPRFEVDIATHGLRERLGEAPFDIVVSAEVVEHLYDPDEWAVACFDALTTHGTLIVTTPYHGYLKNLALSVFDKWDGHHMSLASGEHIKFWSTRTLTQLLARNGLIVSGFRGAGRLPYLWKSMVVSATCDPEFVV